MSRILTLRLKQYSLVLALLLLSSLSASAFATDGYFTAVEPWEEIGSQVTNDTTAFRPGFEANVLPANDDGSRGRVPIGFTLNFFGDDYSSLFVNNNGNVTFDATLSSFTPFALSYVPRVIIAPFWADVDTRVGNVVTYGTGSVDGRPAFGVNWPGVACFSQNTRVLNYFQLVLIDRSDIALGDFDIEFNYDSIQWETGMASGGNAICQGGRSARIGFSNGTGVPGTFFELAGSGTPGSFLDSNTSTGLIHNSLNSTQLGRYVFSVRTGSPDVSSPPPAITHVSGFRALAVTNSVTVAWQTVQEVNLTGFHVYRSTGDAATFERITDMPIPSQGTSESGAVYEYVDQARNGHYVYQLVSVEVGGEEIMRAQTEAEVTAEARHLFVPMLQR